MNSNQTPVDSSNDVEIRMLFERTKDNEIIIQRLQVSKDTPLSCLCESVLLAWGKHPNIDDLTFILAQNDEGSVIVTKPILLKHVESYRHLYA